MGIFDWLFGKKKKDTHISKEDFNKIMEDPNTEVKINIDDLPESPIKSIDDLDLDPEIKEKLRDETVFVGDDGILPGFDIDIEVPGGPPPPQSPLPPSPPKLDELPDEIIDWLDGLNEPKKKWTRGVIEPGRFYSHAIDEILINRPKRRISILTSDDYILSSDEYDKIRINCSINYVFLFANDLQSNGEHKKAIYLYEGIIRLLTVRKASIKNTEIREKLIVDGKELPGNFLIDKGEVFDDADKNTEVHFIPIYGIYFNMGTSYNTLKFHEEAKEAFEDAKLNYKGSDSKIHHHLGCTKIFLRDFTSCIEDFNNAITTDSNYYDSYYMRAVAYASDECEFNDRDKALSDVKKYLEFNPTDKAANNLLKILKN